jgi:ABC-type multidrug transport system ATPase subunit
VAIAVADFPKADGETVAVVGIAFTVEPREILGLVGPDGAGKALGLRRPVSGNLPKR